MHPQPNEAGRAWWAWIPGLTVVAAVAVLVAIDTQAGSGSVDQDELGGGPDPTVADDLDEASPAATFTATSTPTSTATFAATSTPTNTPTNTPTSTPTNTPTATPTNTPV